jgi:hypothetical protein
MMRLVARGAVRVAVGVVLIGLRFAVKFADLLGQGPREFRQELAILGGATRQNGDGKLNESLGFRQDLAT